MGLISVNVPGKVMLSGEYAVLYGGTAALMPVPLFLKVSESENKLSGEYSPVIKAALDLEIVDLLEFEEKHGKPHIDIDRSMLFGSDQSGKPIKLGLGSSAAEAVGVIKLRFKRAGHEYQDAEGIILEYALMAHEEAQGGIGSGADVAACTFASPIRFAKPYESEFKTIVPIEPEYEYPMHLLWTGISADTREMVDNFQRWAEIADESEQDILSDLIDVANELAEMWFVVEEDEIFERLDEYAGIMNSCARMAGIPYRKPIHEEIENWAIRHGGRAKPTGAGGGDMILLIGELPVNKLSHLVIPLNFKPFEE